MIVRGIAVNTWKQFVRDRIFYIALGMALLMVAFSYLLATLTIVESRKILLDFGFSAVSLAGALTAVYIGVSAMAREIEQRTIYSVITKPISRSSYLLGKFLGGCAVLAVAQALMAGTIWAILYELGEGYPSGMLACFALIYLENLILLAVAFLCSVFTNSVAASGLAVGFFLIGRSSAAISVMSEKSQTAGTRVLAKLLYYVMPNLERFNIRDVVAYDRPYPAEMLWIGPAYALAFVVVCLAAANLILCRRDFP